MSEMTPGEICYYCEGSGNLMRTLKKSRKSLIKCVVCDGEGKLAKIHSPDREKVLHNIRVALWRYFKEKLTPEAAEDIAEEISALFDEEGTDPQAKEFGWYIEHGWTPPEELKMKKEGIRKDERERIIEWMGGKCTEHWANSTPFRWRCLECWQDLKEGK